MLHKLNSGIGKKQLKKIKSLAILHFTVTGITLARIRVVELDDHLTKETNTLFKLWLALFSSVQLKDAFNFLTSSSSSSIRFLSLVFSWRVI